MKAGSNLLVCCALIIGAGAVNGQDQSVGGPMYAGKPLSSWVNGLAAMPHLMQAANTNYPEVRAVHAIGTNAIPWLLNEMTKQPPAGAGDEQPHVHQLRATAGFWALGETAAPAIPKLLDLLEEQPEWVPKALAGIGLPSLRALQQCITNAPHYVPPYLLNKIPRERAAVSALAALFVAIDAGRIAKSEAAHLLPDVRVWAKDTNLEAAFWADGVLSELREKQSGAPAQVEPCRLSVGDAVLVHVDMEPQLAVPAESTSKKVAADGTIGLWGTQRVRVAGLTPDQAADTVRLALITNYFGIVFHKVTVMPVSPTLR
jgi:hypothetical protein